MSQYIPKNRSQRILCILLLTGSFFAALKCIFIGYQADESYAISLSYRMLLGDKMIAHIWDPHQTSAFLSTFLTWIYVTVFHTTDGVAIWLRIFGTFIHGALSYGIYKVLCNFLSQEYSFYLSILYFNILPKGWITPEFSNLLMWFLTLLLLDLFYLDYKKNGLIAIRCGIWMCGVVLSYPSAILLFPLFLWYLWKQKQYGKKCTLLFAAICLISSMFYLLYLSSYMSFTELLDNLHYMMIGNSGHTEITLFVRLLSYGKQCGQVLLMGAVCTLFVWIFMKLRRQPEENRKEFPFLLMYHTLIVATVFTVICLLIFPKNNDTSLIYTVYFFLFLIAFFFISKMKEQKYNTIKFWLISSILAFIAVLILTDQTIFTSIRYTLPGIVMGLAVILIYTEQYAPGVYRRYAKKLLLVWCFTFIIIKGWEYHGAPYSVQNITRVRGIISEGPAKGILAEYMQCAMYERTCAEILEYTEPRDNFFLLEDDSTGYLFQDVEVASYTTISDPRYNEILLKYWELNPEKYPDVIAIPCWFGELHWDSESWIIQWIENEFDATQIIDGSYYRYYIKK